MNDIDIISLATSIVSVIIACFAIAISIAFYKMSNRVSEDTREAARRIEMSVEKLEKIFNLLYTDTFSMMKDTVTDMRKKIFPSVDVVTDSSELLEQKVDERIAKFKGEIQSDFSKIVGRTDSKISEVQDSLRELLNKAIVESRRVEKEAITETIKDVIVEFLSSRYGNQFMVETQQLIQELTNRFSEIDILKAIIELRDEEIIGLPLNVQDWHDLEALTPIVLLHRAHSAKKTRRSF